MEKGQMDWHQSLYFSNSTSFIDSSVYSAPPRGKGTQEEVAVPAEKGQDQEGQDRSGEGSSAGPSRTSAQPSTGAGASAEVGTPGAEAVQQPAGTAVGDAAGVAGSDAPSKLTRKELARRARQRKLEAIVAEYRRLVAEEEEDTQSTTTSTATAASSSALPGSASQHRPPAVRSRGTAATRHRKQPKNQLPPHSRCKARIHRLTLRVSNLEQEMKRMKSLLKKNLRREQRAHLAKGHRRRQ
ncbi:uncharacterized protein LOC144824092 isoform X2 [Lissotriton helveticus]